MMQEDDEFVWLWEAPEVFGPSKLVEASAAENKPRPFVAPAIVPETFAERMALVGEMAKELFPLKPATEKLRAHVAGMLHSGELEAFGIQVSPAPSAEPEPVPRHMFSDALKINWANSRIKKSGREYEEIEVRRTRPIAPKATPASRRNGRPTKQDEILEIIDEITRSGFDLNSIKREPACDRIRAEAVKRNLNISIGYSDPVLKRALTVKLGPRK